MVSAIYSPTKRKVPNPMDNKLRLMYEAIRDFREPKANRQLALIFMKLPSKHVSIFYLFISMCI